MKYFNLTKNEILQRIGYFRQRKGISAYELGMILGHSKTYFYRIQNGSITLSVDMLLEILEVLEVSTYEFFYPDLASFEKDKQQLKFVKSLTADEFDAITKLIKR